MGYSLNNSVSQKYIKRVYFMAKLSHIRRDLTDPVCGCDLLRQECCYGDDGMNAIKLQRAPLTPSKLILMTIALIITAIYFSIAGQPN